MSGSSPTGLAVLIMPTYNDGSNKFSPYRYVHLSGEAGIQDSLEAVLRCSFAAENVWAHDNVSAQARQSVPDSAK